MAFSKGKFSTCWAAGAFWEAVVVVDVVPPQATSSMAIRARQVGRSLVTNFFPGRIRDFSFFSCMKYFVCYVPSMY